jgi:hypothetical protein
LPPFGAASVMVTGAGGGRIRGGVVAAAPDGSVYVSDAGHSRVRKVAPNGVISTVAGTGVSGSSGDGGPAAQAR